MDKLRGVFVFIQEVLADTRQTVLGEGRFGRRVTPLAQESSSEMDRHLGSRNWKRAEPTPADPAMATPRTRRRGRLPADARALGLASPSPGAVIGPIRHSPCPKGAKEIYPKKIIGRASSPIGRRACSIGLALAALPLSGCTRIYAQSRVDPQTVAVYPQSIPAPVKGSPDGSAACPVRVRYDTHRGAVDLDCFRFPGDLSNGPTAYQQAVGHDDLRNRLAAILMKHSDDVCTIELGRLTANEAAVNATLSILTSGLAAASTVATGDVAKSILSGLATTTNASRGHINAEVYRNVLSPAVARAIESERDRKRAAITLNLVKPSRDYSVDLMIMEVNDYHQVCSFYRGLTLVVDAVDRTKFDAADQQTSLQDAIDSLDAEIRTTKSEQATAAGNATLLATLNTQLTSYEEQRTTLVKQHTAVQAAAPSTSRR